MPVVSINNKVHSHLLSYISRSTQHHLRKSRSGELNTPLKANNRNSEAVGNRSTTVQAAGECDLF